MEIKVNGKAVVLRTRLPGRQTWEMVRNAASEGATMPEYDDAVKQLTIFVESWEFEGDPGDPAAYEALDYFELMDIYMAAQDAFQKNLSGLKNLPKPST